MLTCIARLPQMTHHPLPATKLLTLVCTYHIACARHHPGVMLPLARLLSSAGLEALQRELFASSLAHFLVQVQLAGHELLGFVPVLHAHLQVLLVLQDMKDFASYSQLLLLSYSAWLTYWDVPESGRADACRCTQAAACG